MNKNQAMKDAAGPWLEIAVSAFEKLRVDGATAAQIEEQLEWFERTNPNRADRDVLIVVVEEIRRRLALGAAK